MAFVPGPQPDDDRVQSWIGHGFDTEEGPCTCMIDIALQARCPDPERPMCTLVRIPFHEPGDDGLGGEEEREIIGAYEDDLAAQLESRGVVQFASIRGAGRVDVWYYSDETGVEAIADAVESTCDGYEVEFGSNEDSEWQQYQMLFPDSDAIAAFTDAQLRNELLEQGDDLDRARPVDHYIVAAGATTGRELADEAARSGFSLCRIIESSSLNENGEEVAAFVVHLTKTHPVDPDTVGEMRELLSNLADEHGAIYDGWRCSASRDS